MKPCKFIIVYAFNEIQSLLFLLKHIIRDSDLKLKKGNGWWSMRMALF